MCGPVCLCCCSRDVNKVGPAVDCQVSLQDHELIET